MVCTQYQISFASDIDKLKDVLYEIIVRLKYEISNISDDALFDLRIIFNELLVNAIIHGNEQDPTKRVLVTVQVDGDIVQSTIRDEGDGFDYTQYINGKTAPLENILTDRGRGLLLANSLTDSLYFNESGNEVEFIVYL